MDKQSIRAELQEIKAQRKTLDKREKALNTLLETYTEEAKAQPRRRVPGKVREQQVLDLLRSDPDKPYDNRAISEKVPMPYTSATRAMRKLAEEKQVIIVGDMPPEDLRIAPVIQHKPVKVVPGRKVA